LPAKEICSQPKTVIHRIYWHEDNSEETISAFLSYPDGMGASDEYFWEVYEIDEDTERFFGDDAEKEMEEKIIKVLKDRFKNIHKRVLEEI